MKTSWAKSDGEDRIKHSIEIGEGRVRVQWYDTCPDHMANQGYEQNDYPIADFLQEGSAGQTKVRSSWDLATLAEVLAALRG